MAGELFARWSDPKAAAYIIAEAGVNHNGDPVLARQLIDIAAASGADAVKFQTFKAEKLVSPTSKKAEYQKRALGGEDDGQMAMLKALELSHADFANLKLYSATKGITFLSTPFDEDSADMLDSIGVDAFKVSSGDLTHPDFLRHIAAKGRPMIISSGMATLLEVMEAVEAVHDAGNAELAVLHCVSNYPAAAGDCNLRSMATMRLATGCPVGWSDHTEGSAVSLAAVALGARIVEKHFTSSRDLPGPDHKASIEPHELDAFVRDIRDVEAALGRVEKAPVAAEQPMRDIVRRSLVAERDIAPGTVLSPAMISVKRPGSGIPPKYRDVIVGRTTRLAIAAGDAIPWSAILEGA